MVIGVGTLMRSSVEAKCMTMSGLQCKAPEQVLLIQWILLHEDGDLN
jgi:hypothetical protein